jgi:hypothetical protein
MRIRDNSDQENSDHFFKTSRTTSWRQLGTLFLGQLGPILMAIHPVPLNANWFSHKQKLTIFFTNVFIWNTILFNYTYFFVTFSVNLYTPKGSIFLSISNKLIVNMIPDFRYLINFILLILFDVFDLLCFEWSVKSLTDCKSIKI